MNKELLPTKRRTLVVTRNLQNSLVPVAFFDADSTLRKTRSGKASPHGKHDVKLLNESFSKLRELAEQGFLIAIVSNQAGIEMGYITYPEVEEAFQETIRLLSEENVYVNYYDFAEKKDGNRKPATEMAWRLERKLRLTGKKIDWEKSFMVGDAAWKKGRDTQPDGTPGNDHSSSDRLFAENIAKRHTSFAFFHPKDFFK